MLIGPFNTENSKRDSAHKKMEWGKGRSKKSGTTKKSGKRQLTDENLWKLQ